MKRFFEYFLEKFSGFGYWIEDRIADAEPRHMVIGACLIAIAFGLIGALFS